jgi:hypothetical protein
MVTVTGNFDGKQVILDTVPADLPPNTRVRVTIEKEGELTGLAAIAAMAIKTNLPPDFAAQHHHYVKGLPKR